MNKENIDKLKSYGIFNIDMGRTFECDDGWFEILVEFSENISSIKESLGIEYEVTTVKEKLGKLTIYPYSDHKEINDLINLATNKSRITCEICGDHGKIRNTRWIRSLCEKHYQERLKYENE
jgi:hypothetical protein